MIKKVIFQLVFLSFILLFACVDNRSKKDIAKKDLILNCFQGVDTTRVSNTVGCISGFFKVIDNSLVIKFDSKLSKKTYNKCEIINIDSTNTKSLAELFIFKKGEANLTNICSDIIFDKKEPLRSCFAKKGQIVVIVSDLTDYYGEKKPKVSIFIKELLFTDPKTKKEIRVKNELLWKVLDFGIPG